MGKKPKNRVEVTTLTHSKAARPNIPTAEYDSVTTEEDHTPIRIAVERRNRDLDPQLVWRGKDQQDAPQLLVQTPPIYIQESVHPKLLIDDLLHEERGDVHGDLDIDDMLGDLNGPNFTNGQTKFYQHDTKWKNRMILGDSLQVMSALAEREGFRGKVQCIYIDPPYGIKFNSNFQWSTADHNVKDEGSSHITREPEQIKAFRDTWRDGIHTYLCYLRDRLLLSHSLLHESGSCFLQISEENVHVVRMLLDEVFGNTNFVSMITYKTTSGASQANSLKRVSDYILWYARDIEKLKFRRLYKKLEIDTSLFNKVEDTRDSSRRKMKPEEKKNPERIDSHLRPYRTLPPHSRGDGSNDPREFCGKKWKIPIGRHWTHRPEGFERLCRAGRIVIERTTLGSVYFFNDFGYTEYTNNWEDTGPEPRKSFVVQTSPKPIQRCLLMCTDPGDLVLDPTCGSGTTAYVAEQWGRRWITIDTSRVALALARARIMGAVYPWYQLRDTEAGVQMEAEFRKSVAKSSDLLRVKDERHKPDIREGFVYERAQRIALKSISENSEIDVIWEKWQGDLESLRNQLNLQLGTNWEEWEIPRDADDGWATEAAKIHEKLWASWIARQGEIEASIAASGKLHTIESIVL